MTLFPMKHSNSMHDFLTEPYLKAFRGSFLGLRRWEDLDVFWETLKNLADQCWYIYAIAPVDATQTWEKCTPSTEPSKFDIPPEWISSERRYQ